MLLVIYGTRPEYIKIKPLLKEMSLNQISYKILFTGQHTDTITHDIAPDYKISIVSSENQNRLDSIVFTCMNLPDYIFNQITHILVQGDTTTAMAMSIAAMHRKIKIIHLEAGLRTHDFNNPYPEEANRKLISAIANIHLCPTIENSYNLIKEGIDKNNIYIVGNTGLDNIFELKDKVSYDDKVIITLHRRENHENISEWFEAINKIKEKYTNVDFIMPVHPNPNVKDNVNSLRGIRLVNPLSPSEMIENLLNAKLIITDSGGLQEECSFLNKKCLVCRKVTERPESIGKTTVMVETPFLLIKLFDWHYENFLIETNECPFGDGKSSKKICDILKTIFNN